MNHEDLEKIRYIDFLMENSIVSKGDLNGKIIYINENFTKITGFSPRESIGKNYNILRHPSNKNSIYKNLWDTIKSGKIYTQNILNRNKDGTDFWANLTIIPLKDENGDNLEYLSIIQLKDEKENISKFLSNLDDTVKQYNFYRKNKNNSKKTKIKKTRESFLVLFTHELKTPLNAIINFSEYLLKKLDSNMEVDREKRRGLLSKIDLNAISMLQIVNQILEISKIKSQKLTYCISTFEISKSIKKVITSHEALIEEFNSKIIFEKNKNIFINSDLFRFEQIISNIISNAIKYSHGEILITCTLDNGVISLHVEDNGEGIEDIEGVFKLFEQGDKNIHTKRTQGLGIGLYFVKLLCNDLGFNYKLGKSKKLGGLSFLLTKKVGLYV